MAQHLTSMEMRRRVGRLIWSNCYTFTTIRNPWDRLVSFYHFELTVRESVLAQNPIPFADWIHRLFGEGHFAAYEEQKYRKYLSCQTEWILDNDGEPAVDFIIRFENLAADFEQLKQKIGHADATLLTIKSSDRCPGYRVYYTDYIRDLVAVHYAPDIEYFGYRFE